MLAPPQQSIVCSLMADCFLSMPKSAWTKWVFNLNSYFWYICILVWSVHGIQVEVMFEDVINFAPSLLLEEWQRTLPGHLARSSSSITLGCHSNSDSPAPYKGSAGAPIEPYSPFPSPLLSHTEKVHGRELDDSHKNARPLLNQK